MLDVEGCICLEFDLSAIFLITDDTETLANLSAGKRDYREDDQNDDQPNQRILPAQLL
jgi:hypothetical protein